VSGKSIFKRIGNYFPKRCCSGSRELDVAETRGSISWIAVRDLGYCCVDVAQYLGVTNSCVTRFMLLGKSLTLMILSKIYERSAPNFP